MGLVDHGFGPYIMLRQVLGRVCIPHNACCAARHACCCTAQHSTSQQQTSFLCCQLLIQRVASRDGLFAFFRGETHAEDLTVWRTEALLQQAVVQSCPVAAHARPVFCMCLRGAPLSTQPDILNLVSGAVRCVFPSDRPGGNSSTATLTASPGTHFGSGVLVAELDLGAASTYIYYRRVVSACRTIVCPEESTALRMSSSTLWSVDTHCHASF
jgi:hypothetical protein